MGGQFNDISLHHQGQVKELGWIGVLGVGAAHHIRVTHHWYLSHNTI